MHSIFFFVKFLELEKIWNFVYSRYEHRLF